MIHDSRLHSFAVLCIVVGGLLCSGPLAAKRKATVDWEQTVEHVSKAVVVLEISTTRSLDTDRASTTSGTGFIVDKARGLLLTNRHLVEVAPVRARGILLNHEEIELTPVYRDPIHDFGFYRFDPKKIQYMDVTELELSPGSAEVGTEIRVIGNDAGEKLSILEGTLARLDRPAPKYGRGYNDWNTFYYQAATSTSGGSSGSPVVDGKGRVIALNAGSNRNTASSFYLPITAPARALSKIRRGEPIARGTLQTVFDYEPYDEVRRLGLRKQTETAHRETFPDVTGMLVVRHVIPQGPGEGQLEPGDVLLALDGSPIHDFESIESRLDERVGQTVSLTLERGGTPVKVTLEVDDLQGLIPSEFIEYSLGTLHEVSIQRARAYNHPATGVSLAEAGYSFGGAGIPTRAVIETIDGSPTPDLDTLEAVLAKIPDRARVPVRYHTLAEPRKGQVASITIDRRWSPMRHCTRNDDSGFWDCVPSPEPEATPSEPGRQPPLTASFETVKDPVAKQLVHSICHVRFTIPYRVEAAKGWRYTGAGLVVDAAKGLVITDRGTVPIVLGDASLTFAGSIRVRAKVIALHPIHNIALLQYDPADLGELEVLSARLSSSTTPLEPGTTVYQIGLTSNERLVSQKSEILRVDPVRLASPNPPRFRESNVELYILREVAPSIGGVLTDSDGVVQALWTFRVDETAGNRFAGLPIDTVNELLRAVDRAGTFNPHDLGADLGRKSLVEARDQGLPDDWIAKLSNADPERRQAITIDRVHPQSALHDQTHGGALLLAIDDQPITRPRDVERAIAKRSSDTVQVTLFEAGEVRQFELAPFARAHQGVDRALLFAGALFHDQHPEVGLLNGTEPGGVYVAWYWYGTPAARSSVRASNIVRAVNGTPIADLQGLVEAVRDLKDGEAIRLAVETLDGVQKMATLETDLVYWPTAMVEYSDDEWRWRLLESSAGSESSADDRP